MRIRRTTGLLVLSLMTAFFLAACGGGGDSGSAAPDTSPAIIHSAAKNQALNSAELEATVNPKGLSTDVWFLYSEDPNLVANVITTTKMNVGAGSLDCTVTQKIPSGTDPPLKSSTNYYFKVKVHSSGGDKETAIQPFSTLNLPRVTTDNVGTKNTNSAVLRGTVYPNGFPTNAWFEFGTDITFVSKTRTDNQAILAGVDNQLINYLAQTLTPATTYHYRIGATNTNSKDPTYGAPITFITDGGKPKVTTKSVDIVTITTTGATLKADVDPSGLPTDAWFEYGTDNTFVSKSVTDNQAVTIGAGVVPIEKLISVPYPLGTKVWYRAMAGNPVGQATPGAPFNFITLNPLPIATAGDNQTVFQGKTVTLDGSGSSDGYGGTLTYLWTAPAGVTLSSNTEEKPTFTAPSVTLPNTSELLTFSLTVTSSRGPVSLPVNVNVTVNYGFFDDFNSPDSTGQYAKIQTLGSGSTFTWTPDAGSGAAEVRTGSGKELSIYRNFDILSPDTTVAGVFSLVFVPLDVHDIGNGITIRLGETFPFPGLAYYEISTIGNTFKQVHGLNTETKPFTWTYSSGTSYTLKIRFSATGAATFEVNNVTLATLNGLDMSVSAYDFTVVTKNMDAYYDNIKLEATP